MGAGANLAAVLTPMLEAPLGALSPVRLHPQCSRQSTLVLQLGQGFTEAGLLPSLDSVQVSPLGPVQRQPLEPLRLEDMTIQFDPEWL